MRFSLKPGRTKSTHNIHWTQHPDLPLPSATDTTPDSSTPRHQQHQQSLTRTGAIDRFLSHYAGDRRSIAAIPTADLGLGSPPDNTTEPTSPTFTTDSTDQFASPTAFSPPATSLGRSQTVVQRDLSSYTTNSNTNSPRHSQIYHNTAPQLPTPSSPPSNWPPEFTQLPTPGEQQQESFPIHSEEASMSGAPYGNTPGKTSSESGQNSALDRWSQRRLQRLNTEQGFREQRQGGAQGAVNTPSAQEQQQQPSYINSATPQQQSQQQQQYAQLPDSQPQSAHTQTQPQYQSSRTAQSAQPISGLAIQNQSVNNSRTNHYPQQDAAAAQAYVQAHQQQQQSQYPQQDSAAQYQEAPPRTSISQARSYNHQPSGVDDPSMSLTNNGNLPASKSVRQSTANRQSVHNGFASRGEASLNPAQPGQAGVPAFNASVVPTAGQTQRGQSDAGRLQTPQPATAEDMSEEDVAQLMKDHKELREKYTKVKKYYFEKEDQVKQLQNSLAHQRLSQSRTSLDDSEYSTRFNRLDGLIAQLAFSIRKSWRSIPQWLVTSVNKDAVQTGKQEMTAAGRAFISCWVVEEVFNKHFHPDLEPQLSTQLKAIQLSIRKNAPPAHNNEEEEYLISKVVNWRLATLEGLQDALRSPQCPTYRAQLTDSLKESLIGTLSQHLDNPPISDLEGGVHMITELVVSIAIHLPVESRDVVIEYYQPGHAILGEHMKLESGIPPLMVSVADDAADRASMKSAASDITDMTDGASNLTTAEQPKKRSMLGAFTSSTKSKPQPPGAAQGKGNSSSSLNRPESSHGKDDLPPRVRMAAGIGVQVRNRGVLVKAPVFST